MESILNFGILVVIWLQSLGGWLSAPMVWFSWLGIEEFYLLIAPAVLWCIDPALGVRLGVGLMTSSATNSFFKLLFQGPRPYWYDARVQPLGHESSFGLPSGHAQNAVVVWGLIAARLRRVWTWALVILIILMIGLSRMYLGVHFPSDVIAGWLLGALSLWLILRLEKPFLAWFGPLQPAAQVGLIFIASLVLILAAALARSALQGWVMPPEWVRLAGRAAGGSPPDPLALSGVITPAAALFGLGSGAALLYRQGWFNPDGSFLQRLARYLIGLAGVLILWAGLDAVFPEGANLLAYAFRYLRYALIGLWIAYLAPQVFIRLRLAKPLK
ncbi:MAG: hypothetical protein B6D39_04900 [Anaerolineae bacterium UTCFX2]|jgi:membrane-associated phospholipid phosphatase|nr:phosphatase PAP2 family protein [Anaerolineales bacterium]OQY92317.1 MAG: hypothetical protein B6D39_04900 [Anaerolineae bacterium UTCFX2]